MCYYVTKWTILLNSGLSGLREKTFVLSVQAGAGENYSVCAVQQQGGEITVGGEELFVFVLDTENVPLLLFLTWLRKSKCIFVAHIGYG